jgi:4-diphosphocytidyl-2-C-methyl-D-erythritol kinase
VVNEMIIEKAYAKLNLSLSVLDKREDGFHNLETIMVPVVDLYDTLYFYERDDNNIEVLDNNIKDNIVIRAAKAFQEKYHTKGVTIRLEKRIPLEAGLAGGSADASATLRGLNRLYGLNIPLKELEEIEAEIDELLTDQWITALKDNECCIFFNGEESRIITANYIDALFE